MKKFSLLANYSLLLNTVFLCACSVNNQEMELSYPEVLTSGKEVETVAQRQELFALIQEYDSVNTSRYHLGSWKQLVWIDAEDLDTLEKIRKSTKNIEDDLTKRTKNAMPMEDALKLAKIKLSEIGELPGDFYMERRLRWNEPKWIFLFSKKNERLADPDKNDYIFLIYGTDEVRINKCNLRIKKRNG